MTRISSLRTRADLALMVVCLAWGATFVVVKDALEQVSTLVFLAIRFTIGAAALLIIFGGMKRQHARLHWTHELRAGVLAGFFLFSGYVLQTAGLRYTSAAKAGFITGFYIPLVPLIAAIAFRKLPRWSEIAGIVLATAGMTLLTVQSTSFVISKGDLLVLGCSFAYALHILVLGHYSKQVDFKRLSFYQIATGAFIGWLTFWWVEPVRWHPTGQVIFALVLTGLLATAFAFSIQTWAQQFTTPTRTALIFSLEPVFAWLTSYVFAGEVLSGRAIAGAALILAGILLVELKPL